MERSAAIHEISLLKGRYIRAAEDGRFEDWAACFTEDATAQFMPPPGSTTSDVHHARDMLEWAPKALEGVNIMIRVSMPDIRLLTDRTATGLWATFEKLLFRDGPFAEVTYYGSYHDDYELGDDDIWRIKKLWISRTRHDVIDRDGVRTAYPY